MNAKLYGLGPDAQFISELDDLMDEIERINGLIEELKSELASRNPES